MNKIIQTDVFSKWLLKLKDKKGKAVVLARINRAKYNNFGDHKFISHGVYEMRIMDGAGYRVYYANVKGITYLLLCGGDKSTQKKDIEKSIEILKKIK